MGKEDEKIKKEEKPTETPVRRKAQDPDAVPEPWKEVTKKGKKVLVAPKKLTDGTPILVSETAKRHLVLENKRRAAEGEPLIE